MKHRKDSVHEAQARWKQIKESESLRNNLILRAKAISAIRSFFDSSGYLEVETPLLVALPGMEPFLDPFRTEVIDPKGEKFDGYLITSPEYSMKKLLVAGFTKIYQLGKCFRNNENFGGLHNPEFTMIEWYRTNADYKDLMNELEEMVIFVGKALGVSVPARWERISITDAFRKYASRDVLELVNDEEEFHHVFLNKIEPKLGKSSPTIIYDYPIQMASLSKVKRDDPRYAERFELYIDGIEIANAFTELTDPKEQRKRFENERELRKKLSKHNYGIDEDFLAALEEGMPESTGIALGVDRLLMALLGEREIRNLIAFPADGIFTVQSE